MVRSYSPQSSTAGRLSHIEVNISKRNVQADVQKTAARNADLSDWVCSRFWGFVAEPYFPVDKISIFSLISQSLRLCLHGTACRQNSKVMFCKKCGRYFPKIAAVMFPVPHVFPCGSLIFPIKMWSLFPSTGQDFVIALMKGMRRK